MQNVLKYDYSKIKPLNYVAAITLMRSVQVASFWHGLGAQSSIFSSQFVPLNPVSVQLHSYLHKYTCTSFNTIIKSFLRIQINLKDITCIRIGNHFESFYQILLLYFCNIKDYSEPA